MYEGIRLVSILAGSNLLMHDTELKIFKNWIKIHLEIETLGLRSLSITFDQWKEKMSVFHVKRSYFLQYLDSRDIYMYKYRSAIS